MQDRAVDIAEDEAKLAKDKLNEQAKDVELLMTDRAVDIAAEEARLMKERLLAAEKRKLANQRRTTFAYNPKSLRRSMMMKPPKFSIEEPWQIKKTNEIPLDHYAGDWKFKAHFPRGCKPKMDCRVETLTFKPVNSTKDGWASWATFGTKTGDGCSLK